MTPGRRFREGFTNIVVRADDEWVRIFLATKEVAAHPRCWGVGEDLEVPSHRAQALELKPGADRDGLPPVLQRMGEVATRYFKVATAGTKSLCAALALSPRAENRLETTGWSSGHR